MDPISTASVLTAVGGAVAKVVKDEVTRAIVAGVKQQVNPGVVKKALVTATNEADKQVPELFYRCEKDGRNGIANFLKQYFAGAAMPELRKPFDRQVQPDVACLKLGFEQALEDYSRKETVAVEALEDWLKFFAKTYFDQTNSARVFEAARADYCEQLRGAFDDVKFGGIAVEGQEIDKAEKLADIFVMPDVLEEMKQKELSFKELMELQQANDDRAYTEATAAGGNLDFLSEQALTKSSQQKQLLIEQRQRSQSRAERDKSKVISAKQLLKQNKRAVLLGAPGSGKTTLMSYWAVTTCAAEAEATNPDLPDDCLPILIRIRDLARHPEMTVLEFAKDFAQRELSAKALPKGFFEYWLENGQALILLDGLDEVADTAQRYKVVAKIEAFLGQFEDNPAIITSRPSGYKRDFFRTEEYPHYELQPFDDGKIDEFIDHWYDSRFELASERQRRKESLRKALKAQPRIKRLARNPLLLTIIALIHRYQAQLPRERYKLYDKAVETLLTSWDANKELSNHETLEYLKLDDLRRLMERLAYWIHRQGGTGDEEGGTLIDREELIVQLGKYIKEMKGVERYQAKEEAKRFLELVVRDRAGLLAQQGQDRYAFVHKTFQEYLTAMEIRDRQEEGFEVVLEHVEEHLHDPHWEEVLLLLIAQQKRGNPSKVLEAILNHDAPYEQWLHRNLFFAGMCLAENVPVTKSGLAKEIIQQFVSFESSDRPKISSQVKKKVFQALSSLYETQFDAEAMKQLLDCKQVERWRLLAYRGELYPEQAAIALLALLKDDDWNVRSRAASSLVQLGSASDGVVDGLLALLKDDDWNVRYRAAESLGQLGSASDGVVDGLLALLKDDSFSIYGGRVCDRAATSLTQLGKTSPKVLPALVQWIEQNETLPYVGKGIDILSELVT